MTRFALTCTTCGKILSHGDATRSQARHLVAEHDCLGPVTTLGEAIPER